MENSPKPSCPTLLDVDCRCRNCGSPFVEYDAWTYSNLPLNESEGIGRSWCGTCESDDAGSSMGNEEVGERIEEWIEYRAKNGLDTLEQGDQEYLVELTAQVEKCEGRANWCRSELKRLKP